MKTLLSTLALVSLLANPQLDHADAKSEWRVWRGPNSNGVAASGQKPVIEWSPTKNVLWKVDVPGRGHSSPIVVGDLVVLTTADESAKTQSVIAYVRKTGKPAWSPEIPAGGVAEEIHKKNTHASPTAASDGKQIYATFCNGGAIHLVALGLDGKIRWKRNTGPFTPDLYKFGYAPSPLLYKNTIIVLSDFETGYLAAFATKNGKEVWRTPRRSKHVSYSSPIVGRVAGRDQLLLSGRDIIASYNPKNGKLLWSTPGTTNATCGTMIWSGNLVFASGGYPKRETIAIRADGSKKVVWKNTQKSYEQSMLVHDGYVYAFNDNGIALCWRAKDGKEMWKERLGGPVSASPILANGNIYATNEKGTTWVYKATPKGYEPVAQNHLGNSSFATMAIADGRIFLRHAFREGGKRQEVLYCMGSSE